MSFCCGVPKPRHTFATPVVAVNVDTLADRFQAGQTASSQGQGGRFGNRHEIHAAENRVGRGGVKGGEARDRAGVGEFNQPVGRSFTRGGVKDRV